MVHDALRHPLVVTVEDGVREGGAGTLMAERIHQCAGDAGTPPPVVHILGVPVAYIPHGTQDELLRVHGLDTDGVARTISGALTRAVTDAVNVIVWLNTESSDSRMNGAALYAGMRTATEEPTRMVYSTTQLTTWLRCAPRIQRSALWPARAIVTPSTTPRKGAGAHAHLGRVPHTVADMLQGRRWTRGVIRD